MKTIKQISDEIGVSKQRVYRFIKSQKINSAQQIGSSLHYDEATEAYIKEHFGQGEANGSDSSNSHIAMCDIGVNALLDVLKSELEVKNQQIAELTKALSEAQQATSAAQTLHATAIKNIIMDDVPKQSDEVAKPGIFSRLFGRK